MSSEGVQITIPDFDDDDIYSTPIPFGRPGGASGFGTGGGSGFGSGGGSSFGGGASFGSGGGSSFGSAPGFGGGGSGAVGGSGQDSPTFSTPNPTAERGDRGYFHSRNGSVASEDSGHSIGVPSSVSTPRVPSSKPQTPAHASQSSITTVATRKGSLASLRSAFTKGPKDRNHDTAPPLPPLKNPFIRSASGAVPQTPLAAARRPTTPGSGDLRFARTLNSKPKGHQYARSQHSQSGSVFQTSDNGDFGLGYRTSSPPPMPPLPGGTYQRNNSSGTLIEYKEDHVPAEPDPQTPSDYALHAVFMRFATLAESKIETFLRQPIEREAPVTDFLGPGVDAKLDDLLRSLGKIAQKHAKPVLDSILLWRRRYSDASVSADVLRMHMNRSPVRSHNSALRSQDIPPLLQQRKALAVVYVMCRALVAVVQALAGGNVRDALSESMGYSLEDIAFEHFKKPDLKQLASSTNHRINADLFAKLLGELAEVKFVNVTDLFVDELSPVASGQVPKDLDMRFESLLRGLKYIHIKVWPHEKFEEGAEFMESLAKSFDNAHGFSLKVAFAETLVHLLHPIGKTAQAEVNDPMWAKAIELIWPKARDMMSKPRYWHVAYPLVVTSLCVAPQDYFLKNWMPCFEAGFAKLKDKPYRTFIMNGVVRLIWTYLYRCPEQTATATSKLDSLLKHFFPANRQTVYPAPEDHNDTFVLIVHFVLSRYIEFGTDFVLELVQESIIGAAGAATASSTVHTVISSDRFAIAVKAVLLTLQRIEAEELTPSWPSSSDFSSTPVSDDYPSVSSFLPANVAARPGVQDILDRLNPILSHIAVACKGAVGQMTIFDDQWAYTQISLSYEESENNIIRHHPEGKVVYPASLAPQIAMLETCFMAWPRLWDAKLPIGDVLEMLLYGIIHVEPAVADAAAAALRRFAASIDHAHVVLKRYARFLFEFVHKTRDGAGVRFAFESPRLNNMWFGLLDVWVHSILQRLRETMDERDLQLAVGMIEDAVAGALFLLAHQSRSIHAVGVKVARLLRTAIHHLGLSAALGLETSTSPYRLIELLHGVGDPKSCLDGCAEHLEKADLERLDQWRKSPHQDVLLRIADSPHGRDSLIWRWVYPAFLKDHADYLPAQLRESLAIAVLRYQPFVTSMAGIKNKTPQASARGPAAQADKDGRRSLQDGLPAINQWAMWMNILAAVASTLEPRHPPQHREHGRFSSDFAADREALLTARGLYRHLAPFLSSEYTVFRSTAAFCIGSLPAQGYSQLLEDLGSLAARHFFDDTRTKAGASTMIGRTQRQEDMYTAVARVYYLTAHFLQDQRVPGRQAALAHVLKFVRHTQVFLSSVEMRDRFQLQRLRRYFCGTVERLFDGLASLKDSDRFIPPNMHLSLYRLCEEWCQFGTQSAVVKQRLVIMQTDAARSSDSPQGMADSIERFQTQTKKLSKSAVGTLASLCHRAYFPPDIASSSPLERSQDYLKPLEAAAMLDRLTSILASYDEVIQTGGKKALRLLLTNSSLDASLADEVLRRAFVTAHDSDTSNGRFFEVVADVVCNAEKHGFTFSQVVCLGMSNLCHPVAEIRRNAFRALEAIHQRSQGVISMSQFEAGVRSSSPGTYLRVYRLVTDVLANEHPDKAVSVLMQVARWIPRICEEGDGRLPLLLLQSLEYWVSNIDLMTMVDEKSSLSQDGAMILCHLMGLTLRHVDTHAEQVLTLWTRLLDSPHQHNGHAAILFLLEQSQKVGSAAFAACASKIVACLCDASIGRQLFEELCGVIEPARVLPSLDHKLHFPTPGDTDIWSTLDSLFAEQPRLSLGTGQYALLFLSDVALDRPWEMKARLPVLLHACFTHLDNRHSFVQQRARHLLLQVLRSWMPGYDTLNPSLTPLSSSDVRNAVSVLEREIGDHLWREEEPSAAVVAKIQWLSFQIIPLLEPLHSTLVETWGSLALSWATDCAVRSVAFRSLQIFRALLPPVSKDDLGILIGRLCNTISARDEQVQSYTVEILITLGALASSPRLDVSLLPQLFWCSCACLFTSVEREFVQALSFLEAVLTRLDLGDSTTVDFLISQRPSDWKGSTTLQSALLNGMRSAATSDSAFRLLQRLAMFDDDRLIDPTDARVRDMYTAGLPWFLRDMSNDTKDDSLAQFATRIADLAEAEERHSLSRIMTSFAKGRFRTKDDFLRQSVLSLREHYGTDHWASVLTLLTGLVLNRERWLRVHTLQILKVLFQQKTSRSSVDLPGSELLMPLLRLLEGDLASQALDVLEEPLVVSGGLAAKHVLRMSMRIKPGEDGGDPEAEAIVFGVPEESGWCIARPDDVRIMCRANVEAVFYTCVMNLRPSLIRFEPEADYQMASNDTFDAMDSDEGMVDLVHNLHELSSFFQDQPSFSASPPTQLPDRQSVARWAAILAKSDGAVNGLQTPFLDVFSVDDGIAFSDPSDDGSASDVESDPFIFDSPTYTRNGPSSARYH